MKIYKQDNDYTIYQGDSFEVLDTLEEKSIDAIVTDPPYGLTSITKRFGKEDSTPAKEGKDGSFAILSKGFMGKTWDGTGIEYNVDFWKKCFKVLKPGGYLLAFGGTRTFHRIACAIEEAGFEIRDTLMRLYGSGFPKSMNIGLAIDKKNGVESKVIGKYNPHRDGSIRKHIDNSKFSNIAGTEKKYIEGGLKDLKEPTLELAKKWQGWGTCLKPAYEPIIMARKPVEGTVADNMLKYGVGGINIDECRVGDDLIKGGTAPKMGSGNLGICNFKTRNAERIDYPEHLGRFPANVILTYDENDFDEVCGGMPNENGLSASRYFYCGKASKKDRDEGLEEFNEYKVNDGRKKDINNAFQRGTTLRHNIHPTVKPTELMQYLVRLVAPKGAVVLDPFCGSGSTGKACMYENTERNANYKFIGIEMTEEYLPIIVARIDYAKNKKDIEKIKEAKAKGYEQIKLF